MSRFYETTYAIYMLVVICLMVFKDDVNIAMLTLFSVLVGIYFIVLMINYCYHDIIDKLEYNQKLSTKLNKLGVSWICTAIKLSTDDTDSKEFRDACENEEDEYEEILSRPDDEDEEE